MTSYSDERFKLSNASQTYYSHQLGLNDRINLCGMQIIQSLSSMCDKFELTSYPVHVTLQVQT